MIVDKNNRPMVREEDKWQLGVIDDIQRFCVANEHNFRSLYAEALKKAPQSEADFVLNHFCDALMGITVHILGTHVGDSQGAEEAAVKGLRTKFAHYRAEKLREKIMTANGSKQ